MGDDYDYTECDRLFDQIEPTIGYGTHNDPADVAYKFFRTCYRLLQEQIEALKRGEFICRKCGLRKDGEHDSQPDF